MKSEGDMLANNAPASGGGDERDASPGKHGDDELRHGRC